MASQCYVAWSDFLKHWQESALAAVQSPTARRQRDEGCLYCQQYQPGEMMPPHDASPRCESGRRNHCTCDICW